MQIIMLSKKAASEIAVGILLLIAIVIGGVFWLQGKQVHKSAQQPLAMVNQQQPNGQQKVAKDNKQEVQNIVTTGYKLVQVNNPKMQFSFEVPENWMTETRNSGNKELTTEEKRSFMMDNLPSDKDYLAKMSSKDIETNFKKYQTDGLFPIASVADYKHVSYSDTNWQQVDFTVAENVKPLIAIDNLKNNSCKSPCETCKGGMNKKYELSCNDSPNNCTTGQQQISGFDSNFIKMGISIYEGKPSADKLCSGGSIYYVPVTNTLALKISKQAQGDEQYEKDFNHLLQTLKIVN